MLIILSSPYIADLLVRLTQTLDVLNIVLHVFTKFKYLSNFSSRIQN